MYTSAEYHKKKKVVVIIDESQLVDIKCSTINIRKLRERGYDNIKIGDRISVPIKEISKASTVLVNAMCDICGEEKTLRYEAYNRNIEKNKIYICHKCSVQVRHDKELNQRQDGYYKRLVAVCEENNYLLLSSKDEIKCNTTKVKYRCEKHGVKEMRVNNLLNGRHCPDCQKELANKRFKLCDEEVVRRVKECGGMVVNPREYKNQLCYNLHFICMECGEEFTSSLQRFTQHGGQLCKNCRSKESLGEKKIRHYLEKHNIRFIPEYWFSDCRDVKPLPFDFYLPDLNVLIEFDGRQHYEASEYFHHGIEKITYHDKIKTQYCKQKGFELIRIPYTHINNIDNILTAELDT